MKFNSQICTTRVQSERLLALGLKKETADMVLMKEMVYDEENHCTRDGDNYIIRPIEYLEGEEHRGHIPAWSLHRLIEMADTAVYVNEGKEDECELWFCMDRCYCWNNHESFYATNLYNSIINCIEWLIKEGYFNKEYLV